MHRYKSKITCPYCNYEFNNSWEVTHDGTITCMGCERDFSLEIDVTVEYSTYATKGR